MSEPLPPKVDLDSLKSEIAGILEEAADGLLEGAQADLQAYFHSISTDYVRAMASDPDLRENLIAHLNSQVALLGEIHRIRAVNAGWETFSKITNVAIKAAIAGILAA